MLDDRLKPPSSVQTLTCGDVSVEVARRDPLQQIGIVGRGRFFEEQQVIFLEGANHSDGLLRTAAAMIVYHDVHFGPHGLAHSRHLFDCLFDDEAIRTVARRSRPHLDSGVSLGDDVAGGAGVAVRVHADAIPALSSQEFVDGNAVDLSSNIP